jgi:hypothetical protein
MSDEPKKRKLILLAAQIGIFWFAVGVWVVWTAYSRLGLYAERTNRSLDNVVGLAIGGIGFILIGGISLGYALGAWRSR